MEKILIIKSKDRNNREKFKISKVNDKSIIIRNSEKIRRNEIKAYFYQKNKISILSSLFILFIIFIQISFSQKTSRNLNSINEIILVVKGLNVYKSILTNNIQKPNKIIINGEKHDGSIISFNLTETENTIILSWDTLLTSCEYMFMNFDYILSIDLSNFNSSKVTNMNSMFAGCMNLKTIKLNNLDTSSVIHMDNMFQSCMSLTSLDLSSFNTSLVKSMSYMFNFCTSLVTINLSSFNTSLVTDMDNMFSSDFSLISLDLSNFNTSSLKTLKEAFSLCRSLIYVNLISFIEIDDIEFDNIFVAAFSNLICCIDENKAPKITNYIKSLNITNDCNNVCFTKSSKIIIKKIQCIDECNKDDTYFYEYNNICYDSEEKIKNKNSDYIIESVIDEISENNQIITNKIEDVKETEKNEITKRFSSENFFKESQQKNDKDI